MKLSRQQLSYIGIVALTALLLFLTYSILPLQKNQSLEVAEFRDNTFKTPSNDRLGRIEIDSLYSAFFRHLNLPQNTYINKRLFSRPDHSLLSFCARISDNNEESELHDFGIIAEGFLRLENGKEVSLKGVKDTSSVYYRYLLFKTSNYKGNYNSSIRLYKNIYKSSLLTLSDHEEFSDAIFYVRDWEEFENYEKGPYWEAYSRLSKSSYYLQKADLLQFISISNSNFGQWEDWLSSFIIFSVWLVYLLQLNLFGKLSLSLILLTIILSVFSCIVVCNLMYFTSFEYLRRVVLFNDFTYAITVGLIEEFVKLLPLLTLFLWRRNDLKGIEILQIVAISALTFSSLENSIYFSEYQSNIISNRGLICSLIHISLSCVIGFFLIKGRYKNKGKKAVFKYGLVGYLFAAGLHGLYDFGIFVEAYEGIVLSYLVLIGLMSSFNFFIQNTLNIDPDFYYTKLSNGLKLKPLLLFIIAIIFCTDFFFSALEHGTTQAFHLLTNDFLFLLLFSILYIVKLSNIEPIKGCWKPFNIITLWSYKSLNFLIHKELKTIAGDNYTVVGREYHNYEDLIRIENSVSKDNIILLIRDQLPSAIDFSSFSTVRLNDTSEVVKTGTLKCKLLYEKIP